MHGGARAGRRVIQLAGIAARELDQLGERLRGRARPGDEHVRYHADERDRREVAARIEGEVLHHRLHDRHLRRRREERIPVGRRLRDRLAAGDDASGGPVLDDHRLAQRFGKARAEHARGDVGDAAGCTRDDVADRTRRILLGALRGGQGAHEQARRTDGNSRAAHYSGSTPAAFSTRAILGVSRLIISVTCCGVLYSVTMPRLAYFSPTSGSFMILANSAFSLFTTSAGVPLGAITAHHTPAS